MPQASTGRFTPLVEWVRKTTKPTDVIAVEDDLAVYLYTGRRSVPVETFTPEEYLRQQPYDFASRQLHAIIAHYEPTYVIGSTRNGLMAARLLSTQSPPELRVHQLLPTAAIFVPVAP